jgi:hypothetical protein
VANVLMGPTGNIIKGHVLDVAVEPFVQAMRFALTDPYLYVKWNPKKLGGWGCWEIRRAPEFNSAIDVTEYNGAVIFNVGPRELDLVHHVLDCAFLNYDAIRKLKEMDTWKYGERGADWQDEVERQTRTRRERERESAKNETRAMTNYFRREIRQFKEMIKDGVNPAAIAQHWDRVKEAE